LAEAGEVAPGAGGLLFAPHLEGRIAPHDPEMRGGWLGLRLDHGRGHLGRAILEAVAYEYATYLRAMEELHPGIEFDRIFGIGGGVRSRLWNSIKADVLGVPYEQVAAEETATRGAALIAGAATGLISDLAGVAASVKTTDRQEPDAERGAFYAEQQPRYVDLIQRIASSNTIDSHPSERQLVA
jgi:xylulokinase